MLLRLPRLLSVDPPFRHRTSRRAESVFRRPRSRRQHPLEISPPHLPADRGHHRRLAASPLPRQQLSPLHRSNPRPLVPSSHLAPVALVAMATHLAVLAPTPVTFRTFGGPAASEPSALGAPRAPPRRLGHLLEPAAVAVGGHRGAGENLLGGEATTGTMLYRENTMGSFRRAVSLGASFVEFDVQVTKDGVPVIFHDNVIEWGSAATYRSSQISDLTLAEFKSLCSSQQTAVVRRMRDASLAWADIRREWQCIHEEQMPTLQEMLEELPEHVAFDLEVKMTTPNTDLTSSEEINRMLEPIMQTVQNHAGKRNIVFSSFDPDICVRLSQMQQRHGVMLLTACEQVHTDARRRDVAEAVSVAEMHQLSGVIVDTACLFENPALMTLVKDRGLFLGSYGLRNNDPEWVNQQVLAGVDVVIADDVTSALIGVMQSAPILVLEG